MIHCLDPTGCCSWMGALPTTKVRCRLQTPITWPVLTAFPSPHSLAPSSLPRSVRGSGTAPSPGMAMGVRGQQLGFPRDG